MQGQEVLYNIASFVAVAGTFSTVIDGVQSLKNGEASLKISIVISLALIASILRAPLLLSDQGTPRELLLFIGFMIVEGLSVVLNLLAFRSLPLTMVSIVVACTALTFVILFSRKLLQLTKKLGMHE